MHPRLRALARRVEQILLEEASKRPTFVVLRERKGEIESMLNEPLGFFGIPENGPLELSPIGREDFFEAARCYSVGFSVASIMFMLRATEEVLRCYYCQVTKHTAKGKNWGNLLDILKIPVLKCPQELISLLSDLNQKRNAAMHPKEQIPAEWNLDSARKVLEDSRRAIKMMVHDLNKRTTENS